MPSLTMWFEFLLLRLSWKTKFFYNISEKSGVARKIFGVYFLVPLVNTEILDVFSHPLSKLITITVGQSWEQNNLKWLNFSIFKNEEKKISNCVDFKCALNRHNKTEQ